MRVAGILVIAYPASVIHQTFSMRIVLLLTLFLPASSSLAQDTIPDTTEAWRYVPLEIGNRWEYEEDSDAPPCSPSCSYVTVETITRDTLIAGQTYLRRDATTYRTFPPPTAPPVHSYTYVRFDTLTATVEEWEGPTFNGGCRLDEPFPSNPSDWREIECSAAEPTARMTGGYDRNASVGDSSYATASKTFYYFSGEVVNASYAADIGLLHSDACENYCLYRWLSYALVGGVAYGSSTVVSTEAPPTPADGFSLQTYPNPATTHTTLHLDLTAPATVTVEVLDALGRRLHTEAHVVSGATQFPLDVSGWARGLYLVRATTADGQTATAHVVRR